MAEEQNEMAGWPTPKSGTFVWTEIASNDVDASQAFFTNVFGWNFHKGDAGGMDYREFSTGGTNPVGGLYFLDPAWFGENPPPPHFMIYVAVDDVDENSKRAVELGGKIHKGPLDIPNVGRMCIIEDPSGAKFCTFRAKN